LTATLPTDPKDFLVLSLPLELDEVAPAYRQAPFALPILLLMVAAMTFDLLPHVMAVLLAVLALGLCRCVDLESAYRAINWPSLLLIAAAPAGDGRHGHHRAAGVSSVTIGVVRLRRPHDAFLGCRDPSRFSRSSRTWAACCPSPRV
jgi:hypothetical protein